MHSICVPGSIFHTYVDVTSVIYQKTMQQRCKREYNNFITSSRLKSLKQYHNQSTTSITWAISHRKMTGALLDSVLVNLFIKVLLITF
jgi:hypothetical protein